MVRNNRKPTFFITLFEKQLVRTYLLSDSGDTIKEMSNHYNINIITSTELKKLIEDKVEEFGMRTFTSVTIFENYKANIVTKIINAILRFSNRSPTTIQVINLERSLGSNFIRTLLRFLNYWLISNSQIAKKFLRYLLYISICLSRLKKHFEPNLNLHKIDVLFITSLCPLRGQDIPIGVFFKRKNLKIVGTVRSWDNLSVNGTLPLIPDYFLCHSQYMLQSAVEKQGIEKSKILMSTTPSYQSKFLIEKSKDKTHYVNFSYMCQGLTSNPDDKNFIRCLIDMWQKMPSNFILFIVQHPSFIVQDLNITLPNNVNFIVFNYTETTLVEYYNHLVNMDLVFGGGTTGLLDATFLDVPVIAIKFEVIKQNYWQSALRHFDYYPWTADFFNQSKILAANDMHELKDFILNYGNVLPLDREVVVKFTGNPNLSITKIILSKLLKF